MRWVCEVGVVGVGAELESIWKNNSGVNFTIGLGFSLVSPTQNWKLTLWSFFHIDPRTELAYKIGCGRTGNIVFFT